MKIEIQCLRRRLQCSIIESESCLLEQSLRQSLRRHVPPSDESKITSNDTEHLVPSGTTSPDSGLLLVLFENLVDARCGLLLLYRHIRLARKTFPVHSSSALRGTVDQALVTSELQVILNLSKGTSLTDCVLC